MTAQQPVAVDDFSRAILQALLSDGLPFEMSVPRLGKALGRSASGVMRQLTLMGDVCGMGWVNVAAEDGRFMVRLTSAGLAVAQDLSPDSTRVRHDD